MPPWTHGPTPRTWPARRASEGSHFVRALFAFGLTTAVLVWLAFVVTNNWETLPTILGLVVFGIGQGALVTLVFNVLVSWSPPRPRTWPATSAPSGARRRTWLPRWAPP